DTLKQYLQLGDRPVLAHTLSAFERAGSIDAIILAIDPLEEDYIKNEIINRYGIQKPIYFVPGGPQRQQSVANALDYIGQGDLVLIHDGVRPLVSPKVIEQTIIAAREYGAAAAGMPVKDTIKKVNKDGFVLSTPDRSTLWQIQTPQAFKLDLIKAAHKRAKRDGHMATDDSSLVERLGQPVKLVEGGYHNIKITTREDIEIAQELLKTGVYT
ncbi:MAG TPA: 2-C-methyl-D-erythritol 4-phosphate cytidylyltransferase, partial [Bacillota bacterium]|nr:2-C-methyl-D-erythritol 4-phosphate cytidylyltransferase [Bacillota bacterium]